MSRTNISQPTILLILLAGLLVGCAQEASSPIESAGGVSPNAVTSEAGGSDTTGAASSGSNSK